MVAKSRHRMLKIEDRTGERAPKAKEADWAIATGGTDPKSGLVTPSERARIKAAQDAAKARGKVLMGRVVRKKDGSTEYEEREFPAPKP